MSYTAVFFDLYGTLTLYGDMRAAWSDWLDAFLQELARVGAAMPRARLHTEVDGFLAQPEPSPSEPGRTLLERRIARACRSLGVTLTDADLARLADRVVEAWQAHVSPDPKAVEVVSALRRTHRLALVSNFDHHVHVHRLLEHLELRTHFESVVISGEVGYRKPDPRIFDGVLRSMHLEPEQVCYVGDDAVDVEAAHAAGLHSILIDRPMASPGAHALDRKDYEGVRSSAAAFAAPNSTIRCLTELSSIV